VNASACLAVAIRVHEDAVSPIPQRHFQKEVGDKRSACSVGEWVRIGAKVVGLIAKRYCPFATVIVSHEASQIEHASCHSEDQTEAKCQRCHVLNPSLEFSKCNTAGGGATSRGRGSHRGMGVLASRAALSADGTIVLPLL
jgi:hypothetical protein